MKKIISIIALLSTMVALAGPKADIQKAQELINSGKNDEAIKILKSSKSVKGEEAEYEQINLFLATEAATTETEVKNYLTKATANKNSKSDAAKQANLLLVQLAKTDAEKIKLLEELDKREENNITILAQLSAYYAKTNNSKLKNIETKINALQNAKDKAYYNLLVALNLSDMNSELFKNYVNKTIAFNDAEMSAQAYLLMAKYSYAQNDTKNAEAYLASAEKLAPKNASVLYDAAMMYSYFGQVQKGYDLLKKIEAIEPTNNTVKLDLFKTSVYLKKTSEETKYANALKTNLKATNYDLGATLLDAGAYEGAEKYLKLAQKDNKNADLLLAELYYAQGKKADALKAANNALKNKVQGAQEVIDEINKMK